MNFKRATLLFLMIGEVLFFSFLGYMVYTHRTRGKNILGATIVTPLKKEYLIFPQDSTYRSFFEPKPSMTEEDTPPWALGSVTYTINADGLNDRFDYPAPKIPNAYRIIILGDSFTFGHYINTPENWTELLEDQLNQRNPCSSIRNYEVLNLGVRGYDLDFAAERFRIRGQKYNPDLVIWFINNHHFYSVRELINRREQELSAQMSEEEIKQSYAKGAYFPALEQAIKEMNQKYSVDRLREQENAALYTLDALYKGPLVIVSNHIDSQNMALLKIFQNYRSSKTYIMQTISNIKNIPDAEFPDGHPTRAGHQIYAKEIYEYVLNQQVLCR